MQIAERLLNSSRVRGERLLRESLNKFLDIQITTWSLEQEIPKQAEAFKDNIESLEVGSIYRDRAQRFYQENWLRPRPYTVRDLARYISSLISK